MSITLQIILCIIVADFLTGFFHWLEDTYCLKDLNIPFVAGVCNSNINHHKDPQNMVRNEGLLYTNGTTFIVAIITYFIIFLCIGFSWQLLLIAGLASVGNQVHLWNHQSKTNYWVDFLKDSGIIQHQRQHSRHHIPPYDQAYCVLINFNNAWLDRTNFWRKLEWVLGKTGLKVKRGNQNREGY